MKTSVKIITSVVMLAIICFLAFKIVAGIINPINYEEQRISRSKVIVQQLMTIRTAQTAYKETKGYFTPSFDSLAEFIEKGQLKIVKAIGTVPDSLTEKEALARGIISRDTVLVSVKDSLFKNINYSLKDLGYTHVGKKVAFKMDTATVSTSSGVDVKVFQCYALLDDILDGLDRQLTVNYKSKINDTCIRVGKIDEANNSAGNWNETLETK